MKASELRERGRDDLLALEKELSDRLMQLNIAKATQRITNTAQLMHTRRDIARIKTVLRELDLGYHSQNNSESMSASGSSS